MSPIGLMRTCVMRRVRHYGCHYLFFQIQEQPYLADRAELQRKRIAALMADA